MKRKISPNLPCKESDLITGPDSNLKCIVLKTASLFRNDVRVDTTVKPVPLKYMPDEWIPDTAIKIKNTLKEDFLTVPGSNPPLPGIDLTKQDINRWKMAKRATELFQASNTAIEEYSKPFRRRCSDMPDLPDNLHNFQIAIGSSAATMVYGGLHALAWNAHFDSPKQQLLWRMSACVVMVEIPALLVLLRRLEPYPY
ncbi:MAG: hypothetical protein Q9184_003267 [Pyrenodesmia sp. 2 TL-2023]